MPTDHSPMFPSLLAELDNVRAAIDYSLRASEPALAAELAWSYVLVLGPFRLERGDARRAH